MTEDAGYPGRCACGEVRYRMTSAPMFVHACHCTECQRLSGSAFALNALIEADRIETLAGEPESVPVTGTSGKLQTIHRCPCCKVALWSTYPSAGPKVRFVRVGTLDEPGRIPPDVHIFTSTMLPWMVLPEDVPSVPEFYSAKAMWPAEAQERWRRLKEGQTAGSPNEAKAAWRS
ncbi:GFA family protein [Sphingosinicella sp. CPCC 101087]|uniref:GFA family protein n=1 Tax=Sphingosinicella sp. CPCC 101087 TaxID=2497754 RepID=UPI00101C7085|nr:GFA family protein [Sphingosinicella sp. CPCC 101087]